ncbi:hypothetical protein D1007_35078 [Hordeum vulgare]|nr:hypothetical protein D1007_35078 [Hordeum vulgare]
MDALSAIMCKASEVGILNSFRGISPLQSLSVYADDVAMFIRPTNMDLICVKELLDIFGETSGLRINYTKSAAILIWGSKEDGLRVTDVLHCRLNKFPCKYLGISMAIKKLSRADWQPLLDQVRKLIPAWQRRMIQRPGRLILAKSVISARPIHQFLVLNVPNWVFEEIDKWMKTFFWAGKEKANGGLLPRGVGQGVPPHLPRRPWQGIPMTEDKEAKLVFNSMVKITLRNEEQILFWKDRWLHDFTVGEIAPDL